MALRAAAAARGRLQLSTTPFVNVNNSNNGKNCCRNFEHHLMSYSSCNGATDQENEFLVRLESACLGYPGTPSCEHTQPLDLTIHPASYGGHAVLGRNGTGKSLLSNALANGSDDNYLSGGSLLVQKKLTPYEYASASSSRISCVSFESHESLLAQGGTVYAALTPHGGRVSKAAQFLIVRFGLYAFLNRPVHTLSTGEIRKVLVVRALSTRPQLLVLDNAFDGLDAPSRTVLGELVSKTLRGFRPDILVQGVNAKDTAHTQVLLMTQRPEEIVDEVTTVSLIQTNSHRNHNEKVQTKSQLSTEPRNGRTGAQLLRAALGLEQGSKRGDNNSDNSNNGVDDLSVWSDSDTPLPSIDIVAALWQSGRNNTEQRHRQRQRHRAAYALSSENNKKNNTNTPLLVEATQLKVCRGDTTLIDSLNWSVLMGEKWLVAGGNGAGKSTLSRLLANREERTLEAVAGGALHVNVDQCAIGWVSTELHMSTARSTRTAREVLLGAASTSGDRQRATSESLHVPVDVGETVAEWLGLLSSLSSSSSLLDKPFSKLSQGEQKLVLIGSALAARPSLLLLDEPCQGLDLVHRRLVLGLVERICRTTDISLVYITHHLEESLPSVTHVMHLKDGYAVYTGEREAYDPQKYT